MWQNRFYSCVVEEGAVGAVIKYMELNPVRAGLTQSAGDYVWSSAVTHLGGPDLAGVVWLDAWRAV
ncbi:MAG: transposase, partial [Bryobacteraceae bacterium]